VTLEVLGLIGSARKGGNTDLLLRSVTNGAKSMGADIEIIRLSDLEIHPCLNCGGCDKDGICIQKDDMVGLFEKLLTFDLILLASPVYFMGLSAWTKVMIDRCQSLWVRKFRLNKLPTKSREERKGVFISVSGMKKPTVFDGARTTVKSFFATIHVTYFGDLLFSGIDEKGEIAKHPTALRRAKELGQDLISEFDNPDFEFPQEESDKNSENGLK
jgi:multimeric flavodoxin WrbA